MDKNLMIIISSHLAQVVVLSHKVRQGFVLCGFQEREKEIVNEKKHDNGILIEREKKIIYIVKEVL